VKRIIFALGIVAFCFGCQKENPEDYDLLNTKWILSFIQDTGTNAVTDFPDDAAKRISVFFDDKSDIVWFTGICNVGSGTYTFSPATGEIKINDLITTEVWCKYIEWEIYTGQNLLFASSYEIDGDSLVVFSNGEYNLYFTKD